MTDVMDLDRPLSERISGVASEPRGKGRGGKRGGKDTGRVSSQSSRRSPRASPYAREPTSASEGQWKHDKFAEVNGIKGGTLAARMLPDVRPPGGLADHGPIARKALGDVSGGRARAQQAPALSRGSLSIKGQASSGQTVEVRQLVAGTTALDVEAIFKSCGDILEAKEVGANAETVTVRIKFAKREAANAAKEQFHGQQADGRVLEVVSVNDGTLAQKLGATIRDTEEDILADNTSATGGGMYSDKMASSSIPTAPVVPAARGRGRGRGRRGW